MKETKLVIPVDFTEVTEHALNYAIKLFHDQQPTIVLLHILDDLDDSEAINQLNALKNKYVLQNPKMQTEIVEGRVNDDIGRIAESIEADFVIMGIHSAKRVHKLLGSRAIKVISDSKVPFITVQADSNPGKIAKIAMTIDVEKESVQVAKTAVSLANYFKSEIILIGGDHDDPMLRNRVITNMKVAISHLSNHGISATSVFLKRDKFMDKLIHYCEENGVGMIAATYYMNNFQILSAKFVQDLLENKLNLPVLTIDAQSVGSSSQLSFMM